MYGIVLKNKKMTAKTYQKKLFENNIETRPLFLGMHEQPIFKKMKLFKNEIILILNISQNMAYIFHLG